jgi:hypothetical protein
MKVSGRIRDCYLFESFWVIREAPCSEDSKHE